MRAPHLTPLQVGRGGAGGVGAARESGTQGKDLGTGRGRAARCAGRAPGGWWRTRSSAVGTRRAVDGRRGRNAVHATNCAGDNSPKMGPSAERPWRVPWEAFQRCGKEREVDLKFSWTHPHLGALALANGSEVKGVKRALTVHGFPYRIQIRRRCRRGCPGTATTRHG